MVDRWLTDPAVTADWLRVPGWRSVPRRPVGRRPAHGRPRIRRRSAACRLPTGGQPADGRRRVGGRCDTGGPL